MAPRPVERVVRDPRFERLVPADAARPAGRRRALGRRARLRARRGRARLERHPAQRRPSLVGHGRRHRSLPPVRFRQRPHARPRRHASSPASTGCAASRATSATARARPSSTATRASGSTRPNDIVVASDGAIWFTDPPYGILSDARATRPSRSWAPATSSGFDRATGELAIVTDDMVDPERPRASRPTSGPLCVRHVARAARRGNHHILAFDVVDGRRLERAARLRGDRARRPGRFPGRRRGQRLDLGRGRDPRAGLRGLELGRIVLPEPVGNCTFGGADGRRLFITATSTLWSIDVGIRGAVTPWVDARTPASA